MYSCLSFACVLVFTDGPHYWMDMGTRLIYPTQKKKTVVISQGRESPTIKQRTCCG